MCGWRRFVSVETSSSVRKIKRTIINRTEHEGVRLYLLPVRRAAPVCGSVQQRLNKNMFLCGKLSVCFLCVFCVDEVCACCVCFVCSVVHLLGSAAGFQTACRTVCSCCSRNKKHVDLCVCSVCACPALCVSDTHISHKIMTSGLALRGLLLFSCKMYDAGL